MASKQIHITQGSSEWLAWRQKGIGASDIAALFGVSPYKTKRDLWFEKSGLGENEDEDRSYIFRRGHETEAEIRELFLDHTNIEMNPTCFENDEIFLASLDGYDKSLGILEAKLVGKDVLAKAAIGEIPEHYRYQVQAQLFASDSDKAYWGAKAPKVKQGIVVEIGRDEAVIKKIQEEGRRFWETVQSGLAPEITPQDVLFITEPDKVSVFKELMRLKTEKDKIEEAFEKLETLAKQMAIHPKVKCLGVSITESERQGSVEYLKIPEVKALQQEYLDRFRKKSSKVKTMTFKKEAVADV